VPRAFSLSGNPRAALPGLRQLNTSRLWFPGGHHPNLLGVLCFMRAYQELSACTQTTARKLYTPLDVSTLDCYECSGVRSIPRPFSLSSDPRASSLDCASSACKLSISASFFSSRASSSSKLLASFWAASAWIPGDNFLMARKAEMDVVFPHVDRQNVDECYGSTKSLQR
jgi:hypothetical protein